MNVYELSFWYQDEENADEDEVIIAVYSSNWLRRQEKSLKSIPDLSHMNMNFILMSTN